MSPKLATSVKHPMRSPSRRPREASRAMQARELAVKGVGREGPRKASRDGARHAGSYKEAYVRVAGTSSMRAIPGAGWVREQRALKSPLLTRDTIPHGVFIVDCDSS